MDANGNNHERIKPTLPTARCRESDKFANKRFKGELINFKVLSLKCMVQKVTGIYWCKCFPSISTLRSSSVYPEKAGKPDKPGESQTSFWRWHRMLILSKCIIKIRLLGKSRKALYQNFLDMDILINSAKSSKIICAWCQ